MQYNDDDVYLGLQAGLERFLAEYPESVMQNIRDYVENDGASLLRDALHTWPDPCEGRFVKLSAEMFALAAAVRLHRAENYLSADDLRCTLGFLSWLLNSFKHQ